MSYSSEFAFVSQMQKKRIAFRFNFIIDMIEDIILNLLNLKLQKDQQIPIIKKACFSIVDLSSLLNNQRIPIINHDSCSSSLGISQANFVIANLLTFSSSTTFMQFHCNIFKSLTVKMSFYHQNDVSNLFFFFWNGDVPLFKVVVLNRTGPSRTSHDVLKESSPALMDPITLCITIHYIPKNEEITMKLWTLGKRVCK